MISVRSADCEKNRVFFHNAQCGGSRFADDDLLLWTLHNNVNRRLLKDSRWLILEQQQQGDEACRQNSLDRAVEAQDGIVDNRISGNGASISVRSELRRYFMLGNNNEQ